MHSDLADVLADIAEHIELAVRFVSGLSYEDFEADIRAKGKSA